MRLRIGQLGTRHGHAAGKAQSIMANPATEFVGVYEADATVRQQAQASGQYGDSHWFANLDDLLGDAGVAAIAIEGRNDESLALAHQAIDAGKHIWYDKPGGDDLEGFRTLIDKAQARGLLVQMGYMFRYQPGFQQVAGWVKSGLLGHIFSVRAHMSTHIPLGLDGATLNARATIARHQGGIFYDLGGHMLDQVVWLLGRPTRVTSFLRNDTTDQLPDFRDNTLGVFEYERAIAFIDIAAMTARPLARRFEVYGTAGSAILEPFDPCRSIRLTLEQGGRGYATGEHLIVPPTVNRQDMYDGELAAFIATIRGQQPPDRSPEHELTVQETLLRATRQLG